MTLAPKRPQRRLTDHYHPDLWTDDNQRHFENGLKSELRDIKAEVKSIGNRVLLILGAIGVLVFVIPIIAPFIRSAILGT